MRIFIIGLPASGRTTVAKALSSNLGISYLNPEEWMCDLEKLLSVTDSVIIDNILNPRIFVTLFDPNKDIVIFLNRVDNDAEYKDNQNIAVSVTRDYCFWLASSKLLKKEQWMEFNFAIPGDPSNKIIKKLGMHNTVLLVKSIDAVISYLVDYFNKVSHGISE